MGLFMFCAGSWSIAEVSAATAESDILFEDAFTRGVEAFRRSDLSAAARAFQEAYLLRPTDPKLQSWMGLVRDEQARREAMVYALEDAKQAEVPPAQQWSEPETARPDPPWKRLFKPKGAWLDWDQQQAQQQGETRPEILDVTKRAGYQRLYKEGIGFQPVPGIGISARTEIYEEPNPVDDFVLEAKLMEDGTDAQYTEALLPLFTRSYAVRFVTDYQPWPRFTYEFDDRDVEHEFQTRFGFKNRHLETHAFHLLYSLPEVPFFGQLTLNPWYKRIQQSSDQDVGTFEDKDEAILNFSLQQTPNLEWFFQMDGASSDKTRVEGGSKVKLYKAQVRMKFPQWKLFVIPSAEYSDTDYDPGDDEFTKKDYFVDWGFDITPRLRASSKEQIVMTKLSRAGNALSNPSADVFNTYNTVSYELFKDFDVSLGLDYSKAAGLEAFDNVGLRAEMELFKPGILRAKVGYEFLKYYNIDDELSLLYLRIFLFQ